MLNSTCKNLAAWLLVSSAAPATDGKAQSLSELEGKILLKSRLQQVIFLAASLIAMQQSGTGRSLLSAACCCRQTGLRKRELTVST